MDEFLVSSSTATAGDQDQPAVAGFAGTQFVAVWADRPSGNIKGQLLGVNGAKTSASLPSIFPAPSGPNARSRR